MPLVSVIIPYFRKIKHFRNSISSVLEQTFQDFEILIIYDDEDLNDLEIIEKEFKNNPKIKIIKNLKNYGAGVSRNIGIKHSKGNIIAFIDADDIWLPEKLNNQITFMTKNNLDFTFCDYEKKIKNKSIDVVCSKKILFYNDLIKSCDIGLSTVLLNKNIIDVDLFPPLKTKEDYVAWLKLTKKNINAYNFPKKLVIWNKVKGSLSSNFFQKVSDGFKVYYKYENFGFLRSVYNLLILSINSLKKKV